MTQSVMIFPGQGAQRPGMGDSLREQALYREHLALADELLGFALSQLMSEGPAEALMRTDIAQPALLTLETGLYKLWLAQGGKPPAAVAGHSLGEYSALVVAGVLDFKSALQLVQLRAQLMQSACERTPGAMAAVLRPGEGIADLCLKSENRVVVANLNSPQQLVLSGEADALQAICEQIKTRKLGRVVMLKVSGAFHSPLMEPARAELTAAIEAVAMREPALPVVMNASGAVVSQLAELRALLCAQLTAPVRWQESVQALAQFSSHFVELGPSTLAPLVRQSLATAEVQVVSEWSEIQALKELAG